MEKLTSGRPEFDSICRLCVKLLGTEKVSPIFNNENYNEQISLPERIWFCSSIEVYEGDGLPAHICSHCLLKLNQSFVFRNQCILADNTLKRLVKDDNFTVGNLPDILSEKLEDKIIARDDPSLTDNQVKNILNSSIDEFDNSQNGRHKRNINKIDQSLKKIKMGSKSEEEIGEDIINDFSECESSLHENTELPFAPSHESETHHNECKETVKKKKTRIKRESIKKDLKVEESTDSNVEKENRVKGKRSRKYKVRKIKSEPEVKDDIKLEIKEESLDIFEDFTVEPDVFSFNDEKKDFDFKDEEEEDEDVKERSKKKSLKKSLKDKTGANRRGRPRKYPVIKEKPPYYTCEYCQKVYPSEGGWRYHIHTMHNENYQPFICDLCGKAFKVKKNLEGHKNSVHFHLKQHLCDICGRGFASKYALKVHKIWHNDEKNFPCDVCGTKFRTRGKMNTHRSIHGGPKKFMCHVCSRDFRWKKDFEIHMRTHTGEKPFKCSLCGKAFSSLTNMKKHERNHAGKFGSLNGPEIIETTTIPLIPDERLYKADLPFSFNYPVDDIRNRPVE